jgi:hypothetical protein
VYKALAARYVLLAAVIVLLLCVSIYALSPAVQRSRPAELRQRYRAIAFFGLVASAFLVLQLWFPYLPLYSTALMLGTSVLRFRVIAGEKDDERRRLLAERLKGEHRAYARVNALVGEFICIYDVDPETDYYQEYRSVAQYEAFAVPKEGGQTLLPIPVMKADIDYNRHVNNANYIRMAMEFLPEGFQVAGLRVEYRVAAKLGDTLLPTLYRLTEDTILVTLSIGNEVSAIAEFTAAR